MNTPSVFFIFSLLFMLSSCSSSEKSWTKEDVIGKVAEQNTSGSGYRDFEGKMINYNYVDFGSFSLAIHDNKIKWKGEGGYFDDIVALVEPQISKIDEGIYFMSWFFESGGGDNVCVNFNTNKVYAHLHHPDADTPEDFELIHGDITCGPSTECQFPEGEVMGQFSTIMALFGNIMKFDLPFMGQTERPFSDENKQARKELHGKEIKYKTETSEVVVEVKNHITEVTYKGEPTITYLTYVTKISDGIYFISWMGNRDFSDHIIFNQKNMTVTDQLTKNGVHKEMIFDVSCFDDNCK
ncbi:hypothetical protein [Flammeovirga aprica]|uniref:Uncharacterized protein n=1 Tax=Flammeovirga aprica JL-4 TaxID=694437 RepID=A0A7X9XD91_9BACT|nr:hypothetical protein [Flammeovirga aprica]NME72641.1 hypothetical protein [Flammeovirga aprica JL-4]